MFFASDLQQSWLRSVSVPVRPRGASARQRKTWPKAWLNKGWLQRRGVAPGATRLCRGRPSEKQAGVDAIPYMSASHGQTDGKTEDVFQRKAMERGRPAGCESRAGPVVGTEEEAVLWLRKTL